MKKIKERTMLILLLVVTVLIVGVVAQANEHLNIDDILNNVKKTRKEIELSEEKDKYIMQIGDTKITKMEYELTKAHLEDQDEKHLEEFLTRQVLLKKIAKEKGIKIEENEVLEYIGFIQKKYDEDVSIKELMDKYFEAYGFDESSFWSSNEAYDMYYDFILLGKLREIVILDLQDKSKEKIQNFTQEEIQDLANQELDKLVAKEKSKIEIIKY